MWKKKNKKKALKNEKNLLQKISKFFVNGKPMSQVVHWSLIMSVFALYAVEIANAQRILDNLYGI
jgi:hypothetical protein